MNEVLREAEAFFGGHSRVHRAAEKIARSLDGLGIDYAIARGLAVNFHGRSRMTEDVDVLLTAESLRKFKEACLGRGYLEKFPGSRGVRDTENRVPIDFLLAGGYPGDGKPKPIRFPDPATAGIESDRYRVLSLPILIELKLASGMTAPGRPYDLGDVMELIRVRKLPESFGDSLHPYVRAKYRELWEKVRTGPTEE